MLNSRKNQVLRRLAVGTVLSSGLLAIAPAQAQTSALPINGEVVVGGATWSVGGNPPAGGTINPAGTPVTQGTLDITLNTQNTVINWNSFSIGKDGTSGPRDTVAFATSLAGQVAVLNRVTGGTMTSIDGFLNSSSNIAVWLINPNGILVGSTGAISTGQFVGSTLDIGCADITCDIPGGGVGDDPALSAFAVGGGTINLASRGASTTGISVQAGGTITTSGTGGLALLGAFVDTRGDLQASAGGSVGLVAAREVRMATPGSPLSLTITRGTPVSGTLINTGGTISGSTVMIAAARPADLQNALLNIGGSITATQVSNVDGVIVLGGVDSAASAIDGLATDASGSIAITGAAGSSITSGGNVRIEALGNISFDQTAALTAGTSATTGQTIRMASSTGAISLDGGTGPAGVITAAGDVTLSGATGVAAASRELISDRGSVVVTTAAGDVTLGSVRAGRNVDVNAAGLASVSGNVTAGLTDATGYYYVTGGTGVALGDDADAETQSAAAGVRIRATTGNITLGDGLTLVANRDLTGGEALDVEAVAGSVSAVVTSILRAGYDSITAFDGASNLILRAGNGTLDLGAGVGAGLIAAGGAVSASATIDVLGGARTMRAQTGNVAVDAGIDATLGTGVAAGDVLVRGGWNASLGYGEAGNDVLVRGSFASATLGRALAGRNVDVEARTIATVQRDITAGTIDTNGHYYVTGGDAVSLGDGTAAVQQAAGQVTIRATGGTGTVSGANGLTLRSNSGGVADAGDSRMLTIDAAGAIRFDLPTLASGLSLDAAAAALTAGTPRLETGGSQSLIQVRAGDGADMNLGTVTARGIRSIAPSVGLDAYGALVSGYPSVLRHAGNIQFNTVSVTEALAVAAYDPADLTRVFGIELNGATSATGDIALAATGRIGGHVLASGDSLRSDLTANGAGRRIYTLSDSATLGILAADAAIDLTTTGGALRVSSATVSSDYAYSGIRMTAQTDLRLGRATAGYGDVTLRSVGGDVSGLAIPDVGPATDYGHAQLTATRGNVDVQALATTAGKGLAKLGDVVARDNIAVTARGIDGTGYLFDAQTGALTLTATALATGPSGIRIGTGRAGTTATLRALGAGGDIVAGTIDAGRNRTAETLPGSGVLVAGDVTIEALNGNIRLGSVATGTGSVMVRADNGSVTGLEAAPGVFGHADLSAAVATPAAGGNLAISDGTIDVRALGGSGRVQLRDLYAGSHIDVVATSAAEVIGDVTAGAGLASGHYRVRGTSVTLGDGGDSGAAGENDVQRAFDDIAIVATAGDIVGRQRLELLANATGRIDAGDVYRLSLSASGAIRMGTPVIPNTLDGLLTSGSQAAINAEVARVQAEIARLTPRLSTGGQQSGVRVEAGAGQLLAVGTVSASRLGGFVDPTRITHSGDFAANTVDVRTPLNISAANIELNAASATQITLTTPGYLRGNQLAAPTLAHAGYYLRTNLSAGNAVSTLSDWALLGGVSGSSVALETTGGKLDVLDVQAIDGISMIAFGDLRVREARTLGGNLLARSLNGDITGTPIAENASYSNDPANFGRAQLTANNGSIIVESLAVAANRGVVKLGAVLANSNELPGATPLRGNVTVLGRVIDATSLTATTGALAVTARQLSAANEVSLTLGSGSSGTTTDISVGLGTGAAPTASNGSATIGSLTAGTDARFGGATAVAGNATIRVARDARIGSVSSRTGAVSVTAVDGDLTGLATGPGTFGNVDLTSAVTTAASGTDRAITAASVTVSAGRGTGTGTTLAGKGLAQLGTVTAGTDVTVDAQAISAAGKVWARGGTARLTARHGNLTVIDVEAGTNSATAPGLDIVLSAATDAALATPALGNGSVSAGSLLADRHVTVTATGPSATVGGVATIAGDVTAGRRVSGDYTVTANSAALGDDAGAETQSATGLVRVLTSGNIIGGPGLALIANANLTGGEHLTLTSSNGSIRFDRTASLAAGYTVDPTILTGSELLLTAANGVITLDEGNATTAGVVNAGLNAKFSAREVLAGTRTVRARDGNVELTATAGMVDLGSAFAGVDVLIGSTGDSIVRNDVEAGRDYRITAGGRAILGDDAAAETQRANGVVAVQAGGDIIGGAGLALTANANGIGGEDLTLTSTSGSIRFDRTASLVSGYTSPTVFDAGSELLLTAANGMITLDEGTATTFGAVNAGLNAKLRARDVLAATRTVRGNGGNVELTATAGMVDLGSAFAGVDVLIGSTGDSTVRDDVQAGRDYRITAGGRAVLGDDAASETQRANGVIAVQAGGNIIGGAGLALTANANNAGGEDLTLTSTSGSIRFDRTASLTSGYSSSASDNGSELLLTAANGVITLDEGTGTAAAVDAGLNAKLTARDVLAATRTVRGAAGNVDLTASAGNVDLGGAIAGVDVLISSSADSTVRDNVQAGRNYSVVAGARVFLGDDTAAETQSAGGLVRIDAGGNIVGGAGLTLVANANASGGEHLTVLSRTGNVTFDATSIMRAGNAGATGLDTASAVRIAAGATSGTGIATLGRVEAGQQILIGSRGIDLQAVTGVADSIVAPIVRFFNLNTGDTPTLLGEGLATGAYALSEAELNRVRATQLTISSGTTADAVTYTGDARGQAIRIGKLALDADAGSALFGVYAVDKTVDITGALTASGSTTRTVQIGGDGVALAAGATAAAQASRIQLSYGGTNTGQINVGGAILDLRGKQIAAGRPTFLTNIAGATPADVITNYVANSASSLYNAAVTAEPYPQPVVLVEAGRLVVHYTDYALFQNTHTISSLYAGIKLTGGSGSAGTQPLQLYSTGQTLANSFAAFGTIRSGGQDIGNAPAALLGSSFIGTTGNNPNNSRLNGCLIGSASGGCLASAIGATSFTLGDVTRQELIGTSEETVVAFEPVIGTNNEALFNPFVDQECPEGSDQTQCTNED